MRKESKWVYAVLFMAVLLLAAGNSSTVYAKSNTSKTAYITVKKLSLTKGQSAALSVKNNRKTVKWVSSNKKVASVNGTTKSAAKKIQKETNGTLIRLQPQKAYTKNYSKLLDVAMDEQESDKRPALATTIKNIKQYDTILLGFPIWHGKEPMLVRAFLEKHNVSGKTILPFCTSGGSGISGSMSGIRKYAKGANVIQGKDLFGLSHAGIREWLKKAGVI